MMNALDKLAQLEAEDAKAGRASRELIEALKTVVETFDRIAWRNESLPEATTMSHAVQVARGALLAAGVALPPQRGEPLPYRLTAVGRASDWRGSE